MSLSSAFRAVGNDPGIITWRIEVSQEGVKPTMTAGVWPVVTEAQLLRARLPSLEPPRLRAGPQEEPSLLGEATLPVNSSETVNSPLTGQKNETCPVPPSSGVGHAAHLFTL